MVTPSLIDTVLNSIGGRTSRTNSFFHFDCQVAVIEVARHGFDPHVCDADDRLRQILVGKSYALQHRTCRRAIAPIRDDVTQVLWIEGH
jgi:hypothetical protein